MASHKPVGWVWWVLGFSTPFIFRRSLPGHGAIQSFSRCLGVAEGSNRAGSEQKLNLAAKNKSLNNKEIDNNHGKNCHSICNGDAQPRPNQTLQKRELEN